MYHPVFKHGHLIHQNFKAHPPLTQVPVYMISHCFMSSCVFHVKLWSVFATWTKQLLCWQFKYINNAWHNYLKQLSRMFWNKLLKSLLQVSKGPTFSSVLWNVKEMNFVYEYKLIFRIWNDCECPNTFQLSNDWVA